MKILGLNLGKEKAMPFPEFRDVVRLSVRRMEPGARVENNETGITLYREGKAPQVCNMRNLYHEYMKSPKDREAVVKRWIDVLFQEVPEHGWLDAQMTLRPTLKNIQYVAMAQQTMQKNTPPDSLPSVPFVGELVVIVMRDLPGQAVAVTSGTLEGWGVTFDEALKAAINNMNMLSFPNVANALVAGGSSKKGEQEEVGLVFEGDHLTATWVAIERFRDYVTQRLMGDYVVTVPIRNRLVAIRADEPGLIGQIQQSNRNYRSQAHALTAQSFYVSAATTGGLVTVYQAGGITENATLDANSVFAKGTGGPPVIPTSPAQARQKPVDLSAWGGISETTEDAPPPHTPFGRGKS